MASARQLSGQLGGVLGNPTLERVRGAHNCNSHPGKRIGSMSDVI
jgi:hypothetical protein